MGEHSLGEGSDARFQGRDAASPVVGGDRHISDFNLIWFIATQAERADLPMDPVLLAKINGHVDGSCWADFDVFQLFWRMYENRHLTEAEILLGRIDED